MGSFACFMIIKTVYFPPKFHASGVFSAKYGTGILHSSPKEDQNSNNTDICGRSQVAIALTNKRNLHHTSLGDSIFNCAQYWSYKNNLCSRFWNQRYKFDYLDKDFSLICCKYSATFSLKVLPNGSTCLQSSSP